MIGGMLRVGDQHTLAVLLILGLSAMGIGWARQHDRLVEVDRRPRAVAQFLVDVNSADWIELAQLPGVGETLARRVVESRDERGPYLSVEQLQRVKGMGPKTLDKIRPYVFADPVDVQWSAKPQASGGLTP